MPNGLAEPAMKPIHPDKPEPPIVAGDVWIKKASGKTSVNVPRVKVLHYFPGNRRSVCVQHLPGSFYTWHSERVFRRDWRPC